MVNGAQRLLTHQLVVALYVLGALEMLAPYLDDATGLAEQVSKFSEQGLRVLIFASNQGVVVLYPNGEEPVLPELSAMAVLTFGDELRPYVQETLAGFRAAGIDLKIISGDNPETVAALAKQAGVSGEIPLLSGPQLAEMSEAEFDQAAEAGSIFGRISPDQKEQLVDALRRNGHYVAMTGDGVNDVLSLKKANLGIAMESGSAATRGVADIVLLDDSFGHWCPLSAKGSASSTACKALFASIWNVSLPPHFCSFPWPWLVSARLSCPAIWPCTH